MAKQTVASYKNGALELRCPHCGDLRTLPEWNQMFLYVCPKCGEPVEVVEPKQ